MKKIYITTTLIMALISTFCNAQEFDAKFIIGAAASQIDGDGYGGYNQLGGILGFATSFPLTEEISFQQEISYYGRGSRRGINQAFTDVFSILGHHYIDINGVINYNFDDFVFQGGLGSGFMIYEYSDAFTGGTSKYRPDWFLLGGVGYKVSETVIANVRMQYSLFPFIKGAPYFNRFAFFHNNSLNFSLHFLINSK